MVRRSLMARRSLHFVPGGQARMLEKALTLPADGLILDLEDAVPPERKAGTRSIVREWLGRDFGGPGRWVRMDPHPTRLGRGELRETVAGAPPGHLVPEARHRRRRARHRLHGHRRPRRPAPRVRGRRGHGIFRQDLDPPEPDRGHQRGVHALEGGRGRGARAGGRLRRARGTRGLRVPLQGADGGRPAPDPREEADRARGRLSAMRAMVLQGQAPIERAPLLAEDVPIPTPAGDELLVRVRACGVCRTDLHVVEGDLPPIRDRLVPGHQAVGVVESAPPDTRVRAGDRVGIAWLRRTCGHCEYCATGRENLCERAEFTGWHADGGFAEYAVVPAAFAYAIPETFSDVDAAPLLCAGIIGFRALQRAAVPRGGRLGLWGFGSSAHVTLQVARARGARVHVLTRETSRRELARTLGAAWAGDVGDAPPEPLDSAIVFAPAGELVPLALRRLAP